MGGTTSRLRRDVHSRCTPPSPQAPLTLRGSSRSGSGCHAPASISPEPSSTYTRGRLLLQSLSQPCPPTGTGPCQHPAHACCTPGSLGAGAAGWASPPVEKLPNLPVQSTMLSSHTRKANTDGKPRHSLTLLSPVWHTSCGSAWVAKVGFPAVGSNPYLEDSTN